MNIYVVRKIKFEPGKMMTFHEYNEAYVNAERVYCKGMKEVEKFVGGKLHRCRAGYSGIIGNTEYVAEKCYSI